MSESIRPDFENVRPQLTRLLVYSRQAHEFNVGDWSHLRNDEDFEGVCALEGEVRQAYEGIYCSGRDVAVWISHHFSSFNDVGTFPTLRLYVESFSGSWVYRVEDLKAQVTRAKEFVKSSGSPWAVRAMINVLKSEIDILEATAVLIDELKASDLYARESGRCDPPKQAGGIPANEAGSGGVVDAQGGDNGAGAKSVLKQLDGLFGILEALALVCWILSELCKDRSNHNAQAVLLWLAIAFFLAGAGHVGQKYLLRGRWRVWVVYCAVCVLLGGFVYRFTRPAKEKDSQQRPLASAEKAPTSAAWLPPELPDGCSNVLVFLGGQWFGYSRLFAQISPDNAGTKFAIKDVPEFFLKDLDKVPNYSPRKRDMWVRYSMLYQIGGKTVPYPVQPIVVSNRLFVEVRIAFLNEKRRLVMSDDFDSELPVPKPWDRNYSTNAGIYFYEVVNELTNPVLQVFYTAPNEVHVNGIFQVDSNSVLATFGEQPQLLTMICKEVALDATQRITTVSLQSDKFSEILAIRTNDPVDLVGEMLTNELYRPIFPGQKAVFEYPSNRNPGAFADWVKGAPHQTNSPAKPN